MIGIGILVLLLIIIAIGSALKAPTEHEASQQNPNVNAARDINLSDSSSLTSGNNSQPSIANNTSDGHDASGVKNTAPPQDISAPPISPTPTEAAIPPSANSTTQRIELPGNMSDALSDPRQVDTLSQNISDAHTSTLPTAAATVAPSKGAKYLLRVKRLRNRYRNRPLSNRRLTIKYRNCGRSSCYIGYA